MKTNHQRGFKDPGSFRDRSCEIVARSKLLGIALCIGNDFTNGHRGHARHVRGAKKSIRTRERLLNKKILSEELESYTLEDPV